MPRDGDEWEYADQRGRSSGTRTVFIVLAVLGALMVVGVLGCIGLVGVGIFSFQKQVGGMIASLGSAEEFLDHLQSDRIDQAYAMTSQSFQSRMTRPQFDDWLTQHPLATKHLDRAVRSTNYIMKGSNPSATIHYRLDEEDDSDDVEPDPNQPVKPKPPVKNERPPLDCTLVLIEENGKWVIDQFTVP